MITFSKHTRSTQIEIMDDLSLQGKEMEALMKDLKCVNTMLGGTAITTNGIKQLLANQPKTETVCIADIGCGDGALLRQCANWGRKNGYTFTLIGIDANPFIIEQAIKNSEKYTEIEYRNLDIFNSEILEETIDISICTLFLHHFTEQQISAILKRLLSRSSIGVVVNDLQRSKVAFQLFKVFSGIFIRTHTAKHDGLVSVARGFQKKELINIATNLRFSKQKIRWKWAFRYQWLLFK